MCACAQIGTGLNVAITHVPCHTRGHVVYYITKVGAVGATAASGTATATTSTTAASTAATSSKDGKTPPPPPPTPTAPRVPRRVHCSPATLCSPVVAVASLKERQPRRWLHCMIESVTHF